MQKPPVIEDLSIDEEYLIGWSGIKNEDKVRPKSPIVEEAPIVEEFPTNEACTEKDNNDKDISTFL